MTQPCFAKRPQQSKGTRTMNASPHISSGSVTTARTRERISERSSLTDFMPFS